MEYRVKVYGREITSSAHSLTDDEVDTIYDYMDEMEIDDVDLDEFKDELDTWVVDTLKNIGCDSARSVLKLSRSELLRRTDLEEETVDEILKVLRAEFAEEEE